MNKTLIGVISDTHLSAVDDIFLKLCETYFSHCDYVIHAGDLVSDDILLVIKKPVIAVRGNMDFRSTLPLKRVLEVDGRKIGVIHGYGAPQGRV